MQQANRIHVRICLIAAYSQVKRHPFCLPFTPAPALWRAHPANLPSDAFTHPLHLPSCATTPKHLWTTHPPTHPAPHSLSRMADAMRMWGVRGFSLVRMGTGALVAGPLTLAPSTRCGRGSDRVSRTLT